MSEKLVFRLEGRLANEHTLNFYEAARFQYAAARLIVKLEQFIEGGKFSRKITSKQNRNIKLVPYETGSFEFSILLPAMMAAQEVFINVAIPEIMSYVFERVVGGISASRDDKVLDVVRAEQENTAASIAATREALEIIKSDRGGFGDSQRIIEGAHLRELQRIQHAEMERERQLSEKADELSKIEPKQEASLIGMATPLVSEMGVVLRESADSLDIVSESADGKESNILYLNPEMAKNIERERVDGEITPILVNIVQYNKETGWGKLRLKEVDGVLGFNIPSDVRPLIHLRVLAAMRVNEIYVQAYFVRDAAKEVVRLIVVGILELPDST